MKRVLSKCVIAWLSLATSAIAANKVTVEDFEKTDPNAKVWIVGVPPENAAVQVLEAQSSEGRRVLSVKYHFAGAGNYMGVDVPIKIQAPIEKFRFQMKGDKSGSGYGVYLKDASGEVHKFRDAGTMKIDFDGWKDLEVDVKAGHESWDGDKNGQIDYPVTQVTFEISSPGSAVDSTLLIDNLAADTDASPIELRGTQVSVTSPAYGAEVQGDTKVDLSAPGFKFVTVRCWKQGEKFGSDSIVTTAYLDDDGKGSFVFPADQYPHGPLTVRITGDNVSMKDNCYLQLYNKAGVSWNEGMPKTSPPGAKGLDLLFADDFDGPLSIGDGSQFKYYDHKPIGGAQDFSSIPFTSHNKPNTPFKQMDTYLRIRADAKANSTGLISSIGNDGKGIKTNIPAYFECRFIAQSAIGSWPAFWLMTDHISPEFRDKGCDELDIIEAYGGEGPKSPNVDDHYMVTPHAWAQGDAALALEKQAYADMKNPIRPRKSGIPSNWFQSPHTYGCLITETDTVYYCDDIEIGRHKTLPMSKERPHFFMINMATGGGWPVDLSRYDGVADMYVDYVRVYGKKP